MAIGLKLYPELIRFLAAVARYSAAGMGPGMYTRYGDRFLLCNEAGAWIVCTEEELSV